MAVLSGECRRDPCSAIGANGENRHSVQPAAVVGLPSSNGVENHPHQRVPLSKTAL